MSEQNNLPPVVPAPWAIQPAAPEAAPEAPAVPEVPPVVPEAVVAPAAPEAPTVDTQPAVIEEAPAADMVTVTVPKAYKLRLDHSQEFAYRAGVQQMDKVHAEHWYSKANGVEIYNPK